MKLWLLRAREDLPPENDPWEPWYDKAFGFVVQAKDEEAARRLADIDAGDENGSLRAEGHPWLDPGLSTCVELRVEGEEEYVIMEDFHVA